MLTNNLLHEVANRATAYLAGLKTRTIAPAPESLERLGDLDGPLPENSTPPEEVLELADRYGSPATVACTGGRYFGFVVGGSVPAALAVNWLAGVWDQNAMCNASSPVSGRIEEIALRWLIDLLGLPPNCGGAIVTGAMMGNFTALSAARHAQLMRAGWNVEADGMFGVAACDRHRWRGCASYGSQGDRHAWTRASSGYAGPDG